MMVTVVVVIMIATPLCTAGSVRGGGVLAGPVEPAQPSTARAEGPGPTPNGGPGGGHDVAPARPSGAPDEVSHVGPQGSVHPAAYRLFPGPTRPDCPNSKEGSGVTTCTATHLVYLCIVSKETNLPAEAVQTIQQKKLGGDEDPGIVLIPIEEGARHQKVFVA